MEDHVKSVIDDMNKALDALKRDLTGVRTGRASPQIIEHLQVHVESYGSTMPLNQLGGIAAPDARLLIVNPWDKSTMKDIERAIASAGLGFNPQNDGQVIRIPIPALTTERRQGLVKIVKQHAEESKVRIRGVRRDYNELFKTMADDGDFTDDELKKLLERVQKATDDHVKKVDELCAAKEKEVLEV